MVNLSTNIDFIGIGAARSGSTWISRCLEEHPDILFSSQKSQKELNFFDGPQLIKPLQRYKTNYSKGITWYLNQFPDAEKGKKRGEFSIFYIYYEESSQLIKKHFPDVKLLVTLRNPIDMTYSLHWWHKTFLGSDIPNTFEEALKLGIYKDLGFYYKQLRRYYDKFSKDRLFITLLDDIISKPEEVAKNLYSFLEVDSSFVPSMLYKRINKSEAPKIKVVDKIGRKAFKSLINFHSVAPLSYLLSNSKLANIYRKFNIKKERYPKMNHNTRLELFKLYKKDITNLEKLIEKDLTDWKLD